MSGFHQDESLPVGTFAGDDGNGTGDLWDGYTGFCACHAEQLPVVVGTGERTKLPNTALAIGNFLHDGTADERGIPLLHRSQNLTTLVGRGINLLPEVGS